MHICVKKDIIPILVPEISFIDKYNDVNNYLEMNPSMFIEDDGSTTILVRCVNYRKFKSKNYVVYNSHRSISTYYELKGSIQNNDKLDIESFEYHELQHNYNLPVHNAFWKGMEDIRFITENDILVTVPELHVGGKPAVFKAELVNHEVTNFVSCEPNETDEKNWMPYFDKTTNTHKVLYSMSPFQIKSIEVNELEEIGLDDTTSQILQGYHGSTNGVDINENDCLFLIHVNGEKTIHRWIILNMKTKLVSVSEEFVFFKNSYIEFACSLCKYNERIFVSVGINDNKAFIIELEKENIMKLFSHV
uniref:Uncharacterized protein n=1 Tax=viral metagenome TaxID=1070528 RepID=A0A6C0B071_9ZZZZ